MERAVGDLLVRLGGGSITLVAAVSGGADSMALLHALIAARGRLGFGLVAAHFDHSLREASAADAAHVAAFCAGAGVSFRTAREEVRAAAGESLEDAARRARYGFLRTVAQSEGARYVATAHHLDDQAETVLMHLLRGAGSGGLSGMRGVGPFPDGGADILLLRPLLGISRSGIEEYCAANDIPYVNDSSNGDTAFLRNRIRHRLMPVLREEFGSSAAVIARGAEILAAEDEFLSALASERLRDLSSCGTLDLEGARAAGPALARRILIEFIRESGAEVSFYHVETLLSMEAGRLDLPAGKRAYVEYGRLTVGNQDEPRVGEPYRIIPLIPGKTPVPGGAVLAHEAEAVEKPVPEFAAYLDMDAASGGVLRPREAGDRMHPLGAPGSKPLKDILIDKKVPKEKRSLPLLAKGRDVLWMPGLPPSERAKVGSGTRLIIKLEYIKNGG